MKKLIAKIRRKKEVGPPSRITNETVAEHRERILAGGRRFKYPIQYARHRLVLNAILISIVAAILVVVISWWQLYPAQNTSVFMYSVTKILPLPVASVDGQPVLYSDYLMKYLGAVRFLAQKEQISLKSADGLRQVQYIKQQQMQDAVADAYAIKLAKKMNLVVSDTDLATSLKLQRQSSDGEESQQTQDAAYLDFYGWSPDEYSHVLKNTLLRQKVAYAVDNNANKLADLISLQLKADGSNLPAIASAINLARANTVAYGASGLVPRGNNDGGLANQAGKLQKGQTSAVEKFTTGDGYYFVRLLDINNDQVSYEYIQIPLTTFTKNLDKLKQDNKVNYYISIPKTSNAQ